jgi:hypothetical protein
VLRVPTLEFPALRDLLNDARIGVPFEIGLLQVAGVVELERAVARFWALLLEEPLLRRRGASGDQFRLAVVAKVVEVDDDRREPRDTARLPRPTLNE